MPNIIAQSSSRLLRVIHRTRLLPVVLPLLTLVGCSACVAHGDATITTDAATGRITVQTDRYAARFDQGTLTHLHNKLKSRTMIDVALSPQIATALHTGLYVKAPPRVEPIWLRPEAGQGSRTAVTVARDDGGSALGTSVTFRGLVSADGHGRFYPRASLTVRVRVDPASGDMLVETEGQSPGTPLVGSGFAYSGLLPRSINYAVQHSGMKQVFDFTKGDAARRRGVLEWSNISHDKRTGLGGHLWHAPVTVQAAADDPAAAFAVWAEDNVPRYKFLVMRGKDNAYVTYAEPPYENNHETSSVVWRVNVYDRGWTQAAAPFADSLTRRGMTDDRAPWAEDISLILFGSSAAPGYLEALKDTFPPSSRPRIVLWLPQSWRTLTNTKDPKTHDAYYWDNNFSEETAAQIKAATDAGFRVSVYTNPHYNWGSSDKVVDPEVRKIVARYAKHKLTDTVSGKDLKYGPNNIAYTPYREHMLGTFRHVLSELDVNLYLDTTHQFFPNGRGLVTGLTNYEGAIKLFQGTRAIKQDQFLGTENLNELAVMASGCDYALFFDLHWARGWEKTKARHTHPIVGYLYRDVSLQVSQRVNPWGYGGASYYHLAEEVSERIGTIATGEWIHQRQAPQPQTPEQRHWLEKIRLYATRGLRPVFPSDWEPGVMSYLEADDGQVFVYEETEYGSRLIERSVAGRNKIHSARAFKLATFATDDGYIHDWLGMTDDGRWIGLDIASRGYVLFSEADDSREHLRINELPGGAVIRNHSVAKDIAEVHMAWPDETEKNHTITVVTDRPLVRLASHAVSNLQLIPVGEKQGRHRYRILGDMRKPFALIWAKGVYASFEQTDDFLMPVQFEPGTTEIAARLGAWDLKWNAPLVGPNNPRPGTVYSVDITASSATDGPGTLTTYLTTPSTKGPGYCDGEGPLTFTEGEAQTLTQTGVRTASMERAWCRAIMLRMYSSQSVDVEHVSAVRFVRPQLGVTPKNEIDLGAVAIGAASDPSGLVRVTNTQRKTVTAAGGGKTWATILYGAANLTMPADPKTAWQQENDHTGVVLVGDNADLFELTGDHTDDSGQISRLVGQDGKPGLTGGEKPEHETVALHFKGSKTPGHYTAILRIVTQAGNTGVLSQGTEGQPLAGLYYTDIPVRIEVKED